MSERKFARSLGKPGTAAQLRETVSQVVRESTVQVIFANFMHHIVKLLLRTFLSGCTPRATTFDKCNNSMSIQIT